MGRSSAAEPPAQMGDGTADPREPLPLLRKELGTGPRGLSRREAARRLAVYGPNQVWQRERSSLARQLTRQLVHPLALLLWVAGALAFGARMPVLGWAILAVVLVNAVFALLQEHQAERAVQALAAYLPERARVIRDGRSQAVEAAQLVPGDLVVLEEGDKVPADARLTDGALEVDMSMLTGESAPVDRVASPTAGQPTGDPGQEGGLADRGGGGRDGRGLLAAGHPGRAAPDRRADVRDRIAGRQRQGAPETVLARTTLTQAQRSAVLAAVDELARRGLRMLAIATRRLPPARLCRRGGRRPRPGCISWVWRACTIPEAEQLTDHHLGELLTGDAELVFARSSPETKLKIADALRAHRRIVAMTGDGANDAPALHQAHIGVAMGRSGTDVAREAATMVLTDDNFATVVTAIESGRRVYDNVRKFILYTFAHAVPEVVPFLVFALSGGLVPLPLTVLQILAIDLGTETLPALALGREPTEPGLMTRPPRAATQGVISRDMLIRAWGYLGLVSAVLVMTAFFYVLWRAGWHPGIPTGAGRPFHHSYLTATTATFAGLVTCQVGTAVAARTDHASLRQVGLFSNPLLLAGIAFELAFTAALVYLPPLQQLFGTAALPLDVVALFATFPFIVWGTDELRRWTRRRHRRHGS